MRWLVCFCLLLSAQAVSAQDWALRAGDERLTDGQLEALSNGASVTYYDDGISEYSAGGAYSYTYADGGGTAFGVFRVTEDGAVCVDFRNGFSRCDLFVRKDGALVLLTEKGERFPARRETGLTH